MHPRREGRSGTFRPRPQLSSPGADRVVSSPMGGPAGAASCSPSAYQSAKSLRPMRRGVRAAAVVLLALLLAGCVAAPEQRWIVRLKQAEGANVFVPVPIDEAGEIPKFAKAAEFVKGRATFSFTDSDHGPGIRFEVPPGGGDDVVFSSRQPGARDLAFSTADDSAVASGASDSADASAGASSVWMWSDTVGVDVSVILGDTTLPDCREAVAEAAWDVAGWMEVPVIVGSHCP